MKYYLRNLWLIFLSGTVGLAAVVPSNWLQTPPDAQNPIPIMAYYYIWFDPQSWDRAKTDYPLLGRYSSDDPEIMQQHIQWAKEAGIDGFIVSWKSTYKLDRRLEQLLDIAAEQQFAIWIIYQGLDFERNPLPIDAIDADLDFFIERYAAHPALQHNQKPIVIWSGTWEFTPQQIEQITDAYGDRLSILASERNVEGYLRLANHVAGNAYYWSSVDPQTFPNYEEKLLAMSQAVDKHGGLWIAPAAPGFDARQIGGSRIVPRRDGQTLQQEIDAALHSAPDAIGLISWNEFSENSHIEPSQQHGYLALSVLSDGQIAQPPQIRDFDSSAPGTTQPSSSYPFWVIGGMATLFLVSLVWVFAQRIKHTQPIEQVYENHL